MPQRQRGAGFHFAERKTGVQVFHIRQIDQHVARELAEAVQVAADDLQFKRAGAADVVAADDFGNLADGVFERLQYVSAVARRVQAHEGQHAQADLVAVDLGAVAGDEAGFFQRPHAPPAGRGRQADARRQFGVGQARIELQLVQDGDVKLV